MGSVFDFSTMVGVQFQGANLSGSHFGAVALQSSDFRGADFRSTKIQTSSTKGLVSAAFSQPVADTSFLPITDSLSRLQIAIHRIESVSRKMKNDAAPATNAAVKILQNFLTIKDRVNQLKDKYNEQGRKNLSHWSKISSNSVFDETKTISFLAQLFCEDDTRQGYMAERIIQSRIIGFPTNWVIFPANPIERIITNGSYRFPLSPAVFYKLIKDCGISSRVNRRTWRLLTKAVKQDGEQRLR